MYTVCVMVEYTVLKFGVISERAVGFMFLFRLKQNWVEAKKDSIEREASPRHIFIDHPPALAC